ncbi:hypothetical protein SAMN04515667_1487 [Formosa sp. Hel1_31_208]|uniref:hypothetical protein n=1 Tax=Formosa sp. Hel1_31_208 TaxID=1798225 RepID=UPI00087AB9C7|nr:hypothetical protein [Formosa sp. Hel1_31_208]SDS13390.1 hypothetical protein SAMN04515667_1487 [Formosa sp. Hel1_31_208]
MKKLLCVFVLFAMTFNLQAQEPKTSEADQERKARTLELMGQKIEIDIDTSLFMEVTVNTYISESPRAVVMAMMVPDSYAVTKQRMNENTDPQFKISEKGETEMNGVNVLYMKGTSMAEGSTLDSEMYCMAIDDETCLMVIGMVEQNADAKYSEAIKKAINSVIKKK